MERSIGRARWKAESSNSGSESAKRPSFQKKEKREFGALREMFSGMTKTDWADLEKPWAAEDLGERAFGLKVPKRSGRATKPKNSRA